MVMILLVDVLAALVFLCVAGPGSQNPIGASSVNQVR